MDPIAVVVSALIGDDILDKIKKTGITGVGIRRSAYRNLIILNGNSIFCGRRGTAGIIGIEPVRHQPVVPIVKDLSGLRYRKFQLPHQMTAQKHGKRLIGIVLPCITRLQPPQGVRRQKFPGPPFPARQSNIKLLGQFLVFIKFDHDNIGD